MITNNKKRVLILCTGNSCRSQIAEALINARVGDRWEAVSAGTEPADRVHPRAVQVLAEIGIQHHGAPKLADYFRADHLDLVITVCADAAEKCPVWVGEGKHIHIGFPDPAAAVGTEEEVLAVFRTVRDAIEKELLLYLHKMS